ncbi:MAG: hypothetical protein IH944_02850 [Armatimonadetes bacterium]|nr:hypothetical protein [Armatimonadota bacterium]
MKVNKARVYVPDICVAEAFKALAKNYYKATGCWWTSSDGYQKSRARLRDLVSMSHKKMKATRRKVHVHDVQSDREIIIGVDRFHEAFLKQRPRWLNVGLPDLILASTGRYLMDYYDIPKERLFIVTMDTTLITGINKCCAELPNCHNPTDPAHSAANIFV